MSASKKNPSTGLPKAELSNETAHALGKSFWKLVHLYGFTREEQALLLGVKPENRQRLISLEKEKSIPVEADKFQRVGNLLGIHKNLRILFPHNRELVYEWMKTPREIFHGRSAMEFIKDDPINSFARLFTVRRALDQIRVGS